MTALSEALNPETPGARLAALATAPKDSAARQAARQNPSLPNATLGPLLAKGDPWTWANPSVPLFLLMHPDPHAMQQGAVACLAALSKKPRPELEAALRPHLVPLIDEWWQGLEAVAMPFWLYGPKNMAHGSDAHRRLVRLLVAMARWAQQYAPAEQGRVTLEHVLPPLERWAEGDTDVDLAAIQPTLKALDTQTQAAFMRAPLQQSGRDASNAAQYAATAASNPEAANSLIGSTVTFAYQAARWSRPEAMDAAEAQAFERQIGRNLAAVVRRLEPRLPMLVRWLEPP